ncbi:LysR family transcriptional regulator [Paraburkholderia sp. SIMBA_030]|uniref:LysR family transcriptional regulator n=2 Tax=Pseudomonadati TaxID=3379134 RepID=UPI0039781A9D
MLNIRHLAAVRAVLRTGSISSGARMLFLTQPAVTKSIQLAEEELGVQLFTRVKGRLTPTEESRFLYGEIERIFGDMDNLQNLASEVRQGHAGRIMLATVSNLSASLVARAITNFRQRHGAVRFDLEVHSTKLVLEAVRIGQVVLGVLDLAPDVAGLDHFELCDAEIGCVMRVDHPLATAPLVTPAMLRDEMVVTFPDDTTVNTLVREAFRHAQVNCNVGITANHSYSACCLVSQGNGIGLIDPFHVATGIFPDLVIRPFAPAMRLRPTVVVAEGRTLSKIAREFVDELKLVAMTLPL